MKLCVPTDDDWGLVGRLSSHFGSAPYFTLVDSQTGKVQVVSNDQSDHEPGTCHAAEALPEYGVGAVVCRGMGKRAFNRLQRLGLAVFVTEEEELGKALERFRAGRLSRLTSESACHGGRRHGHSEH